LRCYAYIPANAYSLISQIRLSRYERFVHWHTGYRLYAFITCTLSSLIRQNVELRCWRLKTLYRYNTTDNTQDACASCVLLRSFYRRYALNAVPLLSLDRCFPFHHYNANLTDIYEKQKMRQERYKTSSWKQKLLRDFRDYRCFHDFRDFRCYRDFQDFRDFRDLRCTTRETRRHDTRWLDDGVTRWRYTKWRDTRDEMTRRRDTRDERSETRRDDDRHEKSRDERWETIHDRRDDDKRKHINTTTCQNNRPLRVRHFTITNLALTYYSNRDSDLNDK